MGLLDRLFGGAAKRAATPKDEAMAEAIVDRVVEATDARLKAVPAYRRKLHDAALQTLAHVREVVLAVPGPVEVSASAWGRDPALRPLFARADEVRETFSDCPELRDYLGRTADAQCLALLSLKRTEKGVLAPALRGDAVIKDVARTSVSFGPARVMAPGADERAVRLEVAKRVIDYLGRCALEQTAAMQQQRIDLEQEQALLRSRLKLARQRQGDLSGLNGEASERQDPEALERELAANEDALREHSATGLMPRFLDTLHDVLANPSRHIAIAPVSLALDGMNFLVEPGEAPAVTLNVREIRLGERGPFVVMLANFPRSDLLPVRGAMEGAERWL
jgi:hypothetical protein